MRGNRENSPHITSALRVYDYSKDAMGQRCLQIAKDCKAKTGFGAVLVKEGKVVAQGRNRRSNPGENAILGGGVDYAIHAEQAAILDYIQKEGIQGVLQFTF